MKRNALVLSAIVALAAAGFGSTLAAAAVETSSKITIPGTVVSSQQDKLVIRTDDHGHRMTFDVTSATTLPDGLRRGARVAVTYHAIGATGQAADEVRVVDRDASVQSQAAFKVVEGRVEDRRVGAR
jgi:hypothetical protein